MNFDDKKLAISRDFNATIEQRDRSNEDMRFCTVSGGMWEGWLERTHGVDSSRARMEFDVISDFVNRFVGEWTLNRANVTFTPDDDATSDDDAELLSGIYRSDFKDNDGQIAQDNAVKEVALCGVGAFRLKPRFEDEGDPENENQEIAWVPIYNAFNHVVWDSNAKRVDKADARHCAVMESYTEDAFKDAYPNAEPTSAYVPNNRSFFNWHSPNQVWVAEFYEVQERQTVLNVYRNMAQMRIESYTDDELKLIQDDLDANGWEFVRKRKVIKRVILKSILNGNEYLDKPKRIAGEYIPIIPMYGFRSWVDGTERYHGLVRKMKDANRLINANISRMAESGSASGDSIPILSRDQVEGLEALWSDKTDKPYLVVNDIEDDKGNRTPMGPLGYLEPNQVDPNTVAVTDWVGNFIQRLTGNAPQDTLDPDASGKAINALRKRENLNTQVVSDNIIASIRHSGKVYRSQAREIYARSRIVRIIGPDNTSSVKRLLQSTMDEQGNMIAINDVSKGKFEVDVEVGPQYESQKEATRETIETIMTGLDPNIPGAAEYYPILLTSLVDNIEGTGLDALKKFNRRKQIMMGLIEPETDEEIQMVQMAQMQVDPQEELNKAIANQQNAEAMKLQAGAMKDIATTKKEMALTDKANAETAEIVTDIGGKQMAQALNQIQRFRYNPQTGVLESADSGTTQRQ